MNTHFKVGLPMVTPAKVIGCTNQGNLAEIGASNRLYDEDFQAVRHGSTPLGVSHEDCVVGPLLRKGSGHLADEVHKMLVCSGPGSSTGIYVDSARRPLAV